MTFHDLSRRFFDYNFKINEAAGFTFPGVFFHMSIYIAAKFLVFLVEYYWRYWALQLSLKHILTGMLWTLLCFDAQYFILIG